VIRNVAAALLSLVLALAAAEGVLRLVRPRYEEAAESFARADSMRLWARPPYARYTRANPDTGSRHPVVHNAFGMRQHRDFPARREPGELRVGLFGDSYLENLGMAAPYSVSEVLDYLLNAHPGVRATVLNFGVSGYGTDQAYLSFAHEEAARDLDVALYVFAANDVRNLYENQLFELAPDGSLEERVARPPSGWKAVVGKLWLTQLVRDAWQRAFGETDEEADARRRAGQAERLVDATAQGIHADLVGERTSETTRHYVTLLQRLLARWRADAAARGVRFAVVLLPKWKEGSLEPLFAGNEVINLYTELARYGGGPRPWQFAQDGHWNERGNEVAAVHLMRHLESMLGLAPLDDDAVRSALGRYYRAFADGPSAWTPDLWIAPVAPDPVAEARIRARYTALEHPQAQAIEASAPSALKEPASAGTRAPTR